jgi:prephenate dehydrogenase
MKRVAILGPGLLGGSIALALRPKPDVEVRLWARRAEAVREAKEMSVAALVSDNLEEVVKHADTVVFCMPVGAMPAVASQLLPCLAPSALVTDVGSVKLAVEQALSPIFKNRALFVGSHPMAGSEKAGLIHARADLFNAATCIVTPQEGVTSPEAVARATELWESLGGRVRLLSPTQHDAVCALISHLPHLTAAALVNAVNAELPLAFDFFGPGFRDTTRVAGGLPQMWTEILLENRAEVLKGLRALSAQLERAARSLECAGTADSNASHPGASGHDELHAFLTAAKACRDNLRGGQPPVSR